MRKLRLSLLLLCQASCDPVADARQGRGSADEVAQQRTAEPEQASAEAARSPEVGPSLDAEATPLQDDEPSPVADDGNAYEEEAEPTAPFDYGLIRPSDPPPDPSLLTMHGLAGYEVVAIYDKPDLSSYKLGYLRIGQRIRVTPKVEGPGCPKGFHQLPQGGYACASKGLVVEAKPPYMYRPPAPPRVDQSLPYDYGFVRSWNVPMWWRVPNSAELAQATDERARLEAAREGVVLAATAGPAAELAEANPAAVAKLPSVDAEPDSIEPAPAPAAAPPVAAVPPAPPLKLPLSPDTPWLERGFFVTLSEKIEESGRAWWRTARGAFLEAKYLSAYQAKDFQGNVLEDITFPFGYVMSKEGTKVFELGENGKLKKVGALERRTFVALSEETEIEGKAYMVTTDGTLLRKDDLRLAEPQPLPEGVQPWERWIDVSLAKQMLVAYEGTRPVFVTLVSTGRRNTAEEPFDTPTGRWRIRSKHVSTTMDGNTASDGSYSIQDVPWAMFFQGSYALHGAFWHEGFGRVRSHGCINLGPTDARWLFYWTTPFLPEGWHGVHAHEGSPGTTVIVRP